MTRDRRTLVIGDLHLVRETPKPTLRALIDLIEAHPGSQLVFIGDMFDLSADHPGAPSSVALGDALLSQPGLVKALGEHVGRGGELAFLSGNHDAAIGEFDAASRLRTVLSLRQEEAERVQVSPWFLRRGGLHLEHGHLFDADNALTHPLVAGARSLGVHFVEEFIAPTGAFRYLNANDGTPLKLFLSAFRWYGPRAPYVVYKYFETAFKAVSRSGPWFDAVVDSAAADQAARRFAEASSISLEELERLAGAIETPTMASLRATIERLYLDRVTATVSILGGLTLMPFRPRLGASLLTLGGLGMGLSWALNYDRYGGSVAEALRDGARKIAATSGAALVVMGHAHREHIEEGYANTGSFSFPRLGPGRPFIEIAGSEAAPRAELRHWNEPSSDSPIP